MNPTKKKIFLNFFTIDKVVSTHFFQVLGYQGNLVFNCETDKNAVILSKKITDIF